MFNLTIYLLEGVPSSGISALVLGLLRTIFPPTDDELVEGGVLPTGRVMEEVECLLGEPRALVSAGL